MSSTPTLNDFITDNLDTLRRLARPTCVNDYGLTIRVPRHLIDGVFGWLSITEAKVEDNDEQC